LQTFVWRGFYNYLLFNMKLMKFTSVAKVIITFKSSAMKSFIPVLAILLLASGCTTAYKSGQTPDDVYYSPERPQDDYVRVENRDERKYRNVHEYRDDRTTRMRVRDRRWSTLEDDYLYYSYRPYFYTSPYFFNNPWDSHLYWNHFYNPYHSNIIVVNPRTPVSNRPRTFNMNTYNPPVGNSNTKTGSNPGDYWNSGSRNSSPSTNSRPSSNSGNILRGIFGSDNSSSSGSSGGKFNGSNPTNSTNTSSGSSSSGGSTESRAPVRRF
jgi:hypothetical protein